MTRAQEKAKNPSLRLCYENYECVQFDNYEDAIASENQGRPVYLVCKMKGYGGIEETVAEKCISLVRPTEEQERQFLEDCRRIISNESHEEE